MKRRNFLGNLSSTSLAVAFSGCAGIKPSPHQQGAAEPSPQPEAPKVALPATAIVAPPQPTPQPLSRPEQISAQEIKRRQDKSRDFDRTFDDDIFVAPDLLQTFKDATYKLSLLKSVVGYGNFNLISFDEAIKFARTSTKAKAFTASEIAFLDHVFHENAQLYGFYGDKVTTQLTATFPDKDAYKVPGTGHYLLKGEPVELYHKIKRELGPTIILTSGIRSVVKQLHLFLAKAIKTEGNLSKASRSLAPPGHSYHGIGDFDVGKRGLGARNFSNYFASTWEYEKLISSGYVQIRYNRDNLLGVRYEPWHIKVT